MLATTALLAAACGATDDDGPRPCAIGSCPGQADGGDPGDGAAADADPLCSDVVCDSPPAPECVDDQTLATWGEGSCAGGACSYQEEDHSCVGSCSNARCRGGWSPLADRDPPAARYGHSAVWTGSEMIVWGGAYSSTGSYADGARFDPGSGDWSPLPDQGAPSARRDHSAVWTGSEMIVWGGSSITAGGNVFADGARFDPATDRWSPLAAAGAPAARFAHSAVWTGSEMIVWGGASSSTGTYGDGARFDPATNHWTPLPAGGAPAARRDHVAVWTGSEMIVWGGSSIHGGGSVYADGRRFDPLADQWSPLAGGGAPAGRFGHAAAWTGSDLILWGGAASSTGTYGDGGRLDPAIPAWRGLPAAGAPTARRQHTAIWTGSEVIVWGGSTILDGGTVFDDGARFRLYQ